MILSWTVPFGGLNEAQSRGLNIFKKIEAITVKYLVYKLKKL